MWWRTDQRPVGATVLSRRSVLGGLAVGTAGLTLSACGFQPMYGGSSGGAVTANLGQVEIARINDRNGQVLRNALERRFERSKNAQKKLYLLTITLQETIDEIGLSKDSFATRADMILSATFSLTADKTALLGGTSEGIASYNILDQQYATVVSEKDARNRAIEQIADDITRRISAYFSRQPAAPTPAR